MEIKTIKRFAVLCVCGLWAAVLTAAPTPVPQQPAPGAARQGLRMDRAGQIDSIECGAEFVHAPVRLAQKLGGDFTLTLWFRATDKELLGASTWDKERRVPMTVVEMANSDGKERLVVRLMKHRIMLAATNDGGKRWPNFDASTRIRADQWYFLSVVRDGRRTLVYVNDVFAGGGSGSHLPALNGLDTIVYGRFESMRFFHGSIMQPRVYNSALSLEQIRDLYANHRPVAIEQAAVGHARTVYDSYGDYPALQVVEDELHPLIDQLHVGATVLVDPADARRKNILLGNLPRNMFGSRVALFKNIGTDADGLPYYDNGTTLYNVPGSHFFATTHPDGSPYIYAHGNHTPWGGENLIRYPLLGYDAEDLPQFGEVEAVTVDGKNLTLAFGSPISGWVVADIDGDGIPDLVVSSQYSDKPRLSYTPDGLSMWQNVARPNAGPGRGYDIDGNWLGGKVNSKLFWAKGKLGADRRLEFADKKPIFYRHEGFIAQWSSWERERAINILSLQGQPTLVYAGDIDRILAMPIRVEGGQVFLDEAQPLLEGGPSVRDTYFVHNISILDQSAEGGYRLLLDGNPGRLVVLEGSAVGGFRELGAVQTQGGAVAVDTLANPIRGDWDGDGYPDLLVGDSSGLLTLWRGTPDPLVYHGGRVMSVNGERVQHQAGETGSIQGPVERRWGYLQPTLGDWDDNGEPVVITNDITGTLMLYRKAADAASPYELAEPLTFTKDGRDYKVAWRIRPAVLPKSYNYRGTGLPVLLHIDWDGDLAVAVPTATGSNEIARVDKLLDEAGAPIRLSGPAGLWGRTKLSVSEWYADGKWHIVLGSSRETQNSFMEESEMLPGASPLLLENVGTNSEPVFKKARSIRLKDGTAINFDIHNATAVGTHLTAGKDEAPDLIVGAEDGKIYYFLRSELKD